MRTSVVVVGAGPGGLAMSHHLTGAGVDHVLLERGEVAQSWRTERWDSLRLLTPNWMTALPGARYEGDDPDGYMTAAETVTTLEAYRSSFDPPLHIGIEVEAACHTGDGFEVRTTGGTWRCDAVVAATGGSSEPRVPAFASGLPQAVRQLTSLSYRRPAQMDDRGRVLVVGASASGVQIADELQRAGRDVTIAVGEHVRLPRTYRGCDIYRWLERIGQLGERWDEVEDLQRARRHASVQVVGSDDGREVDLPSLQALGVQLVGRLMALRGTTALCSGGLGSLVANADLKEARLLGRIDEWIDEHDMADLVGSAVKPTPTVLAHVPTASIWPASGRSSGRRGSAPRAPGWIPGRSTGAAGSATKGVSRTCKGSTCWVSRSCGADVPTFSPGWASTCPSSEGTSWSTWRRSGG